MTKEMRELLNSINAKKAEAKQLLNSNKLEEAKAMKNEIVAMQEKYDLLAELEEEPMVGEPFLTKEDDQKETVNATDAFLTAIKAKVSDSKLNKEVREALNATTMSEGVPADGGLTVPQDIKTQIKELRRSGDALEKLVTVESVSTLSGSRVLEVDAEHVPFDNVDEKAEFPEVEGPTFKQIEYKVKKKGGILKATRELFQDTAENLRGYIVRWIAKKSRATRNALIIKKLDEVCSSATPITGIDEIKDIFNVELDPAIALSSIVLTNQDGFNYLDKLKDSDGKYILQPDPTQVTRRLLFGKYPVHVVSNKTLKTAVNKVPLYFGDLKEALTIFDREAMSIEFSETASDYWTKDLIGIKVRERLDIQAVDEKAVVKGEITLP